MFAEALAQFQPTLPPASCLDDSSGDIEIRTRAVLSLLWIVDVPPAEPIEVLPGSCPNCGIPVASTRSPYCSDACREASAFVRQFRSGVEEGSIHNHDRQAALGQKLWYVLGGGYPRREVLVPNRVILKVIEREGGKCEECGAKATTIDHSGSG
ncbi:MAG: hypothetical protein JST12_07965 [Armatimonadetes bacterium]|nr:hypothetical protein [Armatimonadota bacterium]